MTRGDAMASQLPTDEVYIYALPYVRLLDSVGFADLRIQNAEAWIESTGRSDVRPILARLGPGGLDYVVVEADIGPSTWSNPAERFVSAELLIPEAVRRFRSS